MTFGSSWETAVTTRTTAARSCRTRSAGSGEVQPADGVASRPSSGAPHTTGYRSRPISIRCQSSPLARRICSRRRPSSTKPNFRYSAIAASLCGNTPTSACASLASAPGTSAVGDHHPDLAVTEARLVHVELADDLAGHGRDERAVHRPTRSPPGDVDRRLGGDSVAFLG